LKVGNAIQLHAKTSAGIGAGNFITVRITSINGSSVGASLQTAGDNQLSEAKLTYLLPEGQDGVTLNGRIAFTFSGKAPPNGSRMNFTAQAGNVACSAQAEKLYFVSSDHLNTPRSVSDEKGNVVWTWEGEPFGSAPASDDNGFQFNLRFPGQYLDQETGLHYNYHRDYDRQIGGYIQSDPIGLTGGTNTYAYVSGNPLTFEDPFGLFGWADMPTLPQEVVDFSAGLGDELLLGQGRRLRDLIGVDGGVNPCATAYEAGKWTGFGGLIATGGIGGLSAAGTKGAGREFSHWIPKRMGGRRSRWNGNYVTPARHYYHDPYRYPTGWRDLGEKWPAWLQQYDRIPYMLKGPTFGAGAGTVGLMQDCTCKR
jgi:RHS repeat-associated protein